MYAIRIKAIAASVAIGLSVSSCAVGPDFKPAAAPDTERYTKEPLPSRTATAAGQAQRFVPDLDIPAEWWMLFRSSKLNALIDRSLKSNPNLEAALAALRVAQENVYAQQGKFFPTVQGEFNPVRQRVATNALSSPPVVGTAADGTPITKNPYNVVTSQVTVAYTIDVWGQNRRAVESLQAQADFQNFQLEAAYLTLTSNTALAAIQEASLRDQIAATRELIGINTKMLNILRKQLDTGYSNRVDVAAQEAQLAQIVATLPPLQKQLAQQRDLLAALSGRYPNEEPPETFTLASFRLPRDLPITLPSKLVEQRPDVRAAQEQVHAASAQVGVAVANMLPSFTISGNAGYTALALGRIADYAASPNAFWTAGGTVTQTLFDGFTLLHQKRAAEAAFDQTAAQYRATVLGSFQNVADTLRALQSDANAVKAASDFERAAKTSFDLVRQQFDSGYANVLLLLNAQQAYLQARIALIQAKASRLSDTVALFQALGGGWWNRAVEDGSKSEEAGLNSPSPPKLPTQQSP
jgi:NodT family efflux transporter outer membrane factor (OMF) lipoprotein